MPPSVELTGHGDQLSYEGVCGGIVGVDSAIGQPAKISDNHALITTLLSPMEAGSERPEIKMDDILDFIFNVATHRIGVRVRVRVLRFLSGRQFEGDVGTLGVALSW